VKIAHEEHEGPRRKNGYKFDSRGLIHQTQLMNRFGEGLDKSSPYNERGPTFSLSPGDSERSHEELI
jgi:hypothetical protein